MKFRLLNVFSLEQQNGNQLAVVFPRETLPDETMKTITDNFGFSETVFVSPHKHLRIFSPAGELPFAGHPTVGAAHAIAQEFGQKEFLQHTLKGQISSSVDGARAKIRFPGDVTVGKYEGNVEQLAEDLGLPGLPPGQALCSGPFFALFELPSRELLARARPLAKLSDKHRPYLVYRESQAVFHVRMLSPYLKGGEDAATGSAACALAAYLRSVKGEVSGSAKVYQGLELGRPSLIEIAWDEKSIHLQGEVQEWGSGELV